MNKQKKQGTSNVSWPIIVICLIVFWPLGVFLFLKKLMSQQLNRPFGRVVNVVGFILLFIGVVGLGETFRTLLFNGIDNLRFNISDFTAGLFFFFGGMALLAVRRRVSSKDRLYRKYAAVVGNRSAVSIQDIAAAMPVSSAKACEDLEKMIDQGFFGNGAFLDRRIDYLLRSSDAYTEIPVSEGGAKEEPAPQTVEGEEFQKIIREIHHLNDQIADQAVSEKIDRIEMTTTHIFKAVQDNPEKMDQLRGFMNYYLPTTLKLLHSYSSMEHLGTNGEHISSTKESIERILDRLVRGFDRQLDQLYKSDSLDISSDIEVLKGMMAKDGFTDDNRIRVD